jgi:hypothetical protein
MVSVPSAENFIDNFPNTLPKIEGKPTYEKLKQAKNLLKQNAASVPSNQGGGMNGYLAIVISDGAYAAISPDVFDIPIYPGISPIIPPGATGPIIAQLVQEHTEALREYREYMNVSAALKKQLTGSIDPVYLRARQDRNTGFANITIRDLVAYCIRTYGKISPADLTSNEAAIKQAWDADTPFELIIDQIEDCQDFAEDGLQPFTDRQIINTAYTLVFNTGAYFDECKAWNIKPPVEKTWDNFKTHFLLAQENLRMQQDTAQQAGFHGANAMQHAITQQMYEEQSVALANLATATSSDRRALETLTNTVAKLTSDLKSKDLEIKKLKSQQQRKPLGDQENTDPNAPPARTPYVKRDMGSYCHTHGYLVYKTHHSGNCKYPNEGHKKEATRTNNMGGCQEGKP